MGSVRVKLYYVKFSELHKKPKVGETQSLIWAFIADADDTAISMATEVGINPSIMSSHQLSQYWKK